MKQISRIILKLNFITLILLVLANFSSQQLSVDPNCPHKINFKGTLKTIQEESYSVDNISISGQYKNITIYPKPDNNNIDPTTNITKFNLDDINSIATYNIGSIYKYKGRRYIEIKLEWKNANNQSQVYLIENYKRVFCYKTESPHQRKEISFEALEQLNINSFSCN